VAQGGVIARTQRTHVVQLVVIGGALGAEEARTLVERGAELSEVRAAAVGSAT
jgi:hypothetical protein